MADKLLPQGGESREDNKKVTYFDHDGPASYTTGGETITAASLGLSVIDFVSTMAGDNGTHFCIARISAKGEQPSFKLLWFTCVDGAEVANAANLSARFTRFRVVSPS